jgi:hypothetical protein
MINKATAVLADEFPEVSEKNALFARRFMLKAEHLPRQARDRHRENSLKN